MTQTEPSTSNQLWLINSLVTFRVSESDGADAVSVLERTVPHGDSPPLHIHHTEDEIFHILEGDFRLVVDGRERFAGPGEVLLAPKGIPHSYRAESPEGGRFVTVTVHGDFERFVRAVGRPAEHAGLPEPAGPPAPEAVQQLAEVAGRFGIEFVGPPLG